MTSNPHESNEEVKGSEPFSTGYDERQRSRWLAPLPIAIVVILLVLILLGAWLILRRSSGEQEVEPIVEVEVVPAERAEMREYVEAGGTLNALPGHEASFSSASAGRATRVLVQVGQHVRAGQTLAELAAEQTEEPEHDVRVGGCIRRDHLRGGSTVTVEDHIQDMKGIAHRAGH